MTTTGSEITTDSSTEKRVISTSISNLSTSIAPYLYLVPSFILILSFVYIPIVIALVVSLYGNPTLPILSDNFIGYYTDFGNAYFVGLGTLFTEMVDNGFYSVFHALVIVIGTLVGFRLLRYFLPHVRTSYSYFISLAVNLVVSTIILNVFLLLMESSGAVIRVPFRNYLDVFTSDLIIGDFLRILLNTFVWATICTFFHVVIGIFLAVLLNGKYKGTKVFRTIFILPWAIPSFITALIWRNFIFDNRQGILGKPARDAVDSGNLTGFVFTFIDLLLLMIFFGVLIWGVISAQDKDSAGKIKNFVLILFVGLILYLVLNLDTTMVPVLGNHFIKIDNVSTKFFYASDFYILGFKTKTIFLAAIITNIWLGVPFMMLSFLATLQSIPNDLYEAAEIDGASAWGKFRSITFPNLIPTLRTVALLGMIWTFNLFNVFYIFSQNQTSLGKRFNWDIFITYIYYLFNQGVRGRPEYAAAAALSFVVFLILVTFSRVYNTIFTEEE